MVPVAPFFLFPGHFFLSYILASISPMPPCGKNKPAPPSKTVRTHHMTRQQIGDPVVQVPDPLQVIVSNNNDNVIEEEIEGADSLPQLAAITNNNAHVSIPFHLIIPSYSIHTSYPLQSGLLWKFRCRAGRSIAQRYFCLLF